MSRTNKREVRVRAVGDRRTEPDVRRIAKAIIRLSIDSQDAEDRLSDLADTEKAIARRRRSTEPCAPEREAS